MTPEELKSTEASFSVLLKAFDDTFSQTVHSRAAYYQVISFGMPNLNPLLTGMMTVQLCWTYRDCISIAVDSL
jgi:hypothetical protein